MHLLLAILLLLRVIHETVARLLFFKALDTGVFPASSINNLLTDNNFGFLLGFWNILWWIVFVITVLWWILDWGINLRFNVEYRRSN